jgi:tyrocidine synthetase-3
MSLDTQNVRPDFREMFAFKRGEGQLAGQATLQELFEQQVDMHSWATAIVCDHDTLFGRSSLTFAEINHKANHVARCLRARGVKPNDVVALHGDRSFALMIGLLGVLKAGAAYLAIPPDCPPERLHFTLQDAGVRFMACQKAPMAGLSFSGLMFDLEDPGLYAGPVDSPSSVNKPEDLACVFYEFGSDGPRADGPRKVLLEHRMVADRLHRMQSAYPIGPGDTVLQQSSSTLDTSVRELLWWAVTGARLCLLVPGGEKSPEAIVGAIGKHRVSVVSFVPSMLDAFLDYLDGNDEKILSLHSLRHVFAAGEALTTAKTRKFDRIVGKLGNVRIKSPCDASETNVDVR